MRRLDPAAMADAIDRYVMEKMRATRVPGIALGIVYGDKLAYLTGYGRADASGRPVTSQTPFALGSPQVGHRPGGNAAGGGGNGSGGQE